MKRLVIIPFIALSSYSSFAQSEEPTITLDEVIVESAKVVNKVDGLIIYPTAAQKEASPNGYSVLKKMTLPNLRIDEISHTITVIDNRGDVQLRINGIIAGKQEMLALDPTTISKIDYIDNPSVRYGDNIEYVINIITRRSDMGYTLGGDITPYLTSSQGNGTAYAKRNIGKNEIAVSYDYSGHKLKREKTLGSTEYRLDDGSVYTIERNDIECIWKDYQHGLKLTYNFADSSAYVFQASISETFSKTPESYSIRDIYDGQDCIVGINKYNDRGHSPVADLYFFRQITPQQSITANAVGTFISSKNYNYFDEITSYQYDVQGETTSLLSEIIYDNRLKPFTLSTGINYRYKSTKNDYVGDAQATTETNQCNVYAFGQINGALKSLRYSMGIGVSYVNYKQNSHQYDLWTFRPKLSVIYNITESLQAKYSFQIKDRASRIAMISDAIIKTNSMEYTKGNPDLKPTKDIENTLQMSYNKSRWQSSVKLYFKKCSKPNMALYERTNDNMFVCTQTNQKEIDLLHLSAHASYWLLPEKLQAAAYGGMQRCFNYGNNYTHCYTSWFYMASITAYLGKFTLTAYTDNGSRWLEGETRGYSGAQTTLQASYSYKDWNFTLNWSNPLNNNYKAFEGEILNCNIHKLTREYSGELGNQIALNVSWRLTRGKAYNTANKRINLKDTETGIIR